MLPMEFWRLSERLIQNEKCAEGFRSAISRAYYAAYHTAQKLLDEMRVPMPKQIEPHKRLASILSHTNDADMDEIGRSATCMATESMPTTA
jgi:uncharacterized protein (UPF0332 family)